MRRAEAQARAKRRGLWSACPAATPSRSPTPGPRDATAGPVPGSGDDCPASHPVKGNGNSGIYHLPGGRFYDVTNPEECFRTPEDAEAAGYRAARGG
jgi:hypothetical protein